MSYHKINQYGEDIAALGRIDPIVALWGPFFLFAALIIWMFYRTAYVPGGQALGALETVFGKLSKRISKLFARREPPSLKADHAAEGEAALSPAE